jgi:hypothetical protein
MSEDRSDPWRDRQDLHAVVGRVAAAFLLTELHNGRVLLDTIEASADRDADERRRSLAV